MPTHGLFVACRPVPVWQCASRIYIEVRLFLQATRHRPRRWLAGCTSGTSPSQETMLLQHQTLRQSLRMQQGTRLQVHPLPPQQFLLHSRRQVQPAKRSLKWGKAEVRQPPALDQAKLWLRANMYLRLAQGASREPQIPSQARLRQALGSQQ